MRTTSALLLALVLSTGCTGPRGLLYPGVARTTVTYYHPVTGKKIAVVEQETSWRQATVLAPPILNSPRGPHALAAYGSYGELPISDEVIINEAVTRLLRWQTVAQSHYVLIDHKSVSPGITGMWSAVIGFLVGAVGAL